MGTGSSNTPQGNLNRTWFVCYVLLLLVAKHNTCGKSRGKRHRDSRLKDPLRHFAGKSQGKMLG